MCDGTDGLEFGTLLERLRAQERPQQVQLLQQTAYQQHFSAQQSFADLQRQIFTSYGLGPEFFRPRDEIDRMTQEAERIQRWAAQQAAEQFRQMEEDTFGRSERTMKDITDLVEEVEPLAIEDKR